MHPKKLSDLDVSDEELGDALTAFNWIFEQLFLISAYALSASLKSQKQASRLQTQG